jgi:DNA processing protein
LTDSAGTDARQPATHHDTDSQAQYAWLVCLRCPALTAARLRQCLDHHWPPSRLVSATITELRQAGIPAELGHSLRQADERRIEQDLVWLAQPGHWLLTLEDAGYPLLLRSIADPPPALFVAGDPSLLNEPQVAIVGSRNPSPQGQRDSAAFARELARAGLIITSGMAGGIDACAHSGALAAHAPTLAVAGTGPDIIYPKKNRDLAAKIIENGAIISEFPPGVTARPYHFPQRNRIISGLSLGVLVIEAALRSGSLITARLAADQGREVFALPGDRHNPLAKGCHRLIRQGAKLVEETRHILEELHSLAAVQLSMPLETTSAPAAGRPAPANAAAHQLLQFMGYGPVTVDELADRSGLTPGSVSSMLLVLELHGSIISMPGGRYTRTAHEGK